MNFFKEATIEMIKLLPDNCTIDDIITKVNFMVQVYEGLKDAENGKDISIDELLVKVDLWENKNKSNC